MADDVLVEQDTLDTITTRNQLNGGIPILDPNGKIYEHYLPNGGGSGSTNAVTYDSTNSLLKYNNGGSTISSPKFTDGIYTPTVVGVSSNIVKIKPSSTAETGELNVSYNGSGSGSIGISLSNATSLGVSAESISVNTAGLNIGNDGNLTYYSTMGNIDFSTEAGRLGLNGYTSTSVSGYSSLILSSDGGSVDIKAYYQVSFGYGSSTAMLIDTQTNNVAIGGNLSLDGDTIRMKGANNTTWDITIDANGNLITTQVIS